MGTLLSLPPTPTEQWNRKYTLSLSTSRGLPGFELRSSHFQGRHLTHQAISLAPAIIGCATPCRRAHKASPVSSAQAMPAGTTDETGTHPSLPAWSHSPTPMASGHRWPSDHQVQTSSGPTVTPSLLQSPPDNRHDDNLECVALRMECCLCAGGRACHRRGLVQACGAHWDTLRLPVDTVGQRPQ